MFEVNNYTFLKYVYPFEWVLCALYIMLIMIGVFIYQVLKMKKNPLYRYYSSAVFVKLISAVGFCLVYIYYYNGGDTVNYYESARAVVNLGLQSPGKAAEVMFSTPSVEMYSVFSAETGKPHFFMYSDVNTWFVIKLIVPVVFVAFRSYVVASVVLSLLSFFGTWKLFLLLNRIYPGMERRLAFGVLFVPSVLFWGSGILKDTITFAAVCWFIYGFYYAMIAKEKRLRNALIFVCAVYVLIMVKPYVIIALFPGSLIWLLHSRIIRIRSVFIRAVSVPLILVMSILIGYVAIDLLGDSLGKFSLEKMLKTASITQYDLKQDYYHGSSFDIGEFEPTLAGVTSKVPAAMTVGLFRPFLWEARNGAMIVSGLENTFYLLLALTLGFRILRSPKKTLGLIFNQPMLLFLLSYSLIFSVLIGLSTSNFGALVRFKIPFLSSFVVLLLVVDFLLRKKNADYFAPKMKGSRLPANGPGVVAISTR